MKKVLRRLGAVSSAALALTPIGDLTARAEPPGIPFIPGSPAMPSPGAYWMGYGFQTTLPPASSDTRGVNIGGVSADPSQTSTSMPGTKPGPQLVNQAQILSNANMRYGIQGGVVPPADMSTLGATPHMFIGGVTAPGGLESPTGNPPAGPAAGAGGEVTDPAPPAYPQLESPTGGERSAHD